MKINLLCIGKTKTKWISSGISHYQNRVSKACNFSVHYLKDHRSGNPQEKKKYDADVFLQKIEERDFVILLDENGDVKTSIQFAEFIAEHQMNGTKKLVFLIGGAFGFDESLYTRAQAQLALSAMTFPHDLVRVLFMEQLYRSYTILHNKKYHYE